VSEREITAAFMDAMASRGVTTPARQDVARFTSPELVAFSAGVVADGYTAEVGRTWPVAGTGNGLFRRCDEVLVRLLGACQPRAHGSELLDAYAAAGEPLPATPIARGLGLGFDDPVIVRDLPETAARERLQAGMVLAVTACVSDDSVIVVAQEPVLITDAGPEVLSSSPFPERS
jgi:Xaa-Pro aminopeptidase